MHSSVADCSVMCNHTPRQFYRTEHAVTQEQFHRTEPAVTQKRQFYRSEHAVTQQCGCREPLSCWYPTCSVKPSKQEQAKVSKGDGEGLLASDSEGAQAASAK